ncbi:MAG: transglycosylase domain-containing protein [Clostridia bacterium]
MKLWKKIILILLVIVLCIGGFFIYDGYQMYRSAIGSSNLKYKVEKVQADKNYITLDELPKEYKDAVVAAEDHRFYQHGAIDIIAIARAIYTNIKEMDLVEGGSTITQQVAKNLYFTQKKQLTRKIAEIFMAMELEKNYSKDQILELYVNTSYFGDGYYGIKEACEGYLNKSPSEMNLDDASLMAGIPNAPSVYAPTKNPDLARKRQQYVLRKMVEYKFIEQEKVTPILAEYAT